MDIQLVLDFFFLQKSEYLGEGVLGHFFQIAMEVSGGFFLGATSRRDRKGFLSEVVF